MLYEVFPDTDTIDVWRVEAIDHDSEGECYVVIFSGPDSERRARDYARLENAWGMIPPGLRDEMLKDLRENTREIMGLIRRKPADGGDETLVKKLGWKPVVWQEVSPDG